MNSTRSTLQRYLVPAGVLALLLLALWLGYALRGGGAAAERPEEAAQAAGSGEEKEETIWTCSMHPQIRLPAPGLCPICNMELIPEKVAKGVRRFVTSEDARKLMDIRTSVVERRFAEAQVRMVGKVAFDETRVKYITAWVPGRLDRLYVDYTGVTVAEGDHMVYLYSPELLAAQEELIGALKAVEDLRNSNVRIMQETAASTVDAARDKLRLWGLKPEQIAEVERRGTAVDHLTIYAPIGGVVVHKDAQEGMYVNTGTRIYTIADLSHLWVKLDAYESDLEWLRYGQEVSVTAEAYPGEVFTGRITFIDPVLDAKTRTVKVRVNMPNPDGKLKPEMFVHGVVRSQVALGGRVMEPGLAGKWVCPMHPEVVKDTAGDCDVCGMPLVRSESLGYVLASDLEAAKPLVVPRTAVLVTGTRAIVYVETPGAEEPTFEGRQIVLGPRAGDYYLVRHGLQEGERVVTNGAFKIDSALQIQAKPSMMTPQGGGGGGHHHGGSEPRAESAQQPQPMKIPGAFTRQLHEVHAAAEAALDAAKADGLAEANGAFSKLADALDSVDSSGLTEDVLLMWQEVAMRLGNDAFEGKEARTLEEARGAAASLVANVAYMQKHFGLAHAPGAEREPAAAEALAVSPQFVGQFGEVLDAYFQMHAALADDDLAGALRARAKARAALVAVDMSLLAGDAHVAWMADAAALTRGLEALARDGDIASAREGFAEFSRVMLAVLKRFDLSALGPAYLLHCPMALDGAGADWLQSDRETRNPYFGSAMLKCGDVTETVLEPRTEPQGGGEHEH